MNGVLQSSPERITEIDALILSHLESLESCQPFFEIIEATENQNYLWISFAAINKALSMFWNDTPIEEKAEFLTKINPILFINNILFESVLETFIEHVKNEPSFEEILNQTLTSCRESLEAATEDTQVINILKIIHEIVNISICRKSLELEFVVFILETIEPFCNTEFYDDIEKCEILKLAFIIKYKINRSALTINRCLVDIETPECLNEVNENVFEMFAAFFTGLEELEEISQQHEQNEK